MPAYPHLIEITPSITRTEIYSEVHAGAEPDPQIVDETGQVVALSVIVMICSIAAGVLLFQLFVRRDI